MSCEIWAPVVFTLKSGDMIQFDGTKQLIGSSTTSKEAANDVAGHVDGFVRKKSYIVGVGVIYSHPWHDNGDVKMPSE